MGQPIPAQHPSVVLRSHFKLVRGLLAIAMVAVLALTATVVILASDDDQVSPATKSQAAPVVQQQVQTPGTRFDGGPEEGTRGLAANPAAPASTRFDGGPEEGTRGPRSYYESPSQRSSYQPAPADDFKDRAGGPTMVPQGPGSR
jgi:hypothetical protein